MVFSNQPGLTPLRNYHCPRCAPKRDLFHHFFRRRLFTQPRPKNDLRNRTLNPVHEKPQGLHPESSAADPVVDLSAISRSKNLANGRRLIGLVARVPDHRDSHAVCLLTNVGSRRRPTRLSRRPKSRACTQRRARRSVNWRSNRSGPFPVEGSRVAADGGWHEKHDQHLQSLSRRVNIAPPRLEAETASSEWHGTGGETQRGFRRRDPGEV
jgi:hypothetical protein